MWNMLQCAVQGRSHIKTNVPCQDKTHTAFENDVSVISLADGAGSASLSHYGADCVTKVMCEIMSSKFDLFYDEEDGVAIKRKIISDLLAELGKVADEHECELKELASTMLVAAVKEDKYILMHIGDGVIGYLKNDEIKVASKPENGEFANTTIFVTSSVVLKSMKILKGRLKGIRGFVLMSDGTEASFYNKRDKSLAPVLGNLMKMTQTMNINVLESEVERSFEKVIKQNTTDDCSIAMLVEEDYSYKGYNLLTTKEKESLFGYKSGTMKRNVLNRYDIILNYLAKQHSLEAVARQLYIKNRYAKKYINFLLDKRLIVSNNGMFVTAILLEK